MVSKVITWAFVAFLVFFTAFRPDSASTAVRRVGSALSAVASGMSDFVAGVVS